jgi:hypothetical protein
MQSFFIFAVNRNFINYSVMEHLNVERIYREIMLLSVTDRAKLYRRIKSEFYKDDETAAHTTAGKSLTHAQYIEEINIGLRQIENDEVLTDDELQKEIDTW